MSEKGFDDILSLKKIKVNVTELSYIALSAGMKFGSVTSFKENLETVMDEARIGLRNLIMFYNKATTPFLACPDSERAFSYNEYSHLERTEEL